MDYCKGGDLLKEINKKRLRYKRFTEKQVAFYVYQVAQAIRYLHAQNIVHRDIKPENLLFLTGPLGQGCGKLKLIDFGCAQRLKNEKEKLVGIYGSSIYVAPEMARGHPYNKTVDNWSLGTLSFLMLFGRPPYSGESDK